MIVEVLPSPEIASLSQTPFHYLMPVALLQLRP